MSWPNRTEAVARLTPTNLGSGPPDELSSVGEMKKRRVERTRRLP
jgi:hypothetical protein